MQTDPFFIGRFISWQGTISRIIAYPTDGQVQLEQFPTGDICTADLANLQVALATGSLFIGVTIEREAAESGELHTDIHSIGKQDRFSEDVVITYMPSLNMKSFFTTSQSPAKKRRFIRHGQRSSNSASKREVEPVKHSTMFQHRVHKSPHQNTYVPHLRAPLSKKGDKRQRTLTKPAENRFKAAERQRTLQVPGNITIRWLNCCETGFHNLTSLATSPQPAHHRSRATLNWEVDHRIVDLVFPDYQSLTKPSFNMLIDAKSRLAIGWYLAFRHA